MPDGSVWWIHHNGGYAERFGANGDSLEVLTLGAPGQGTVRDIIPTADGGLVAVGWIRSQTSSNRLAAIARFAPDGSLTFAETFGNQNGPTDGFVSRSFDEVFERSDGSFVIGSCSFAKASGLFFCWCSLVAVASDGTLLWWLGYSDPTDGSQLLLLPDDSVVQALRPGARIARVDMNGALDWIGQIPSFTCHDLAWSPAGTVIAVGRETNGSWPALVELGADATLISSYRVPTTAASGRVLSIDLDQDSLLIASEFTNGNDSAGQIRHVQDMNTGGGCALQPETFGFELLRDSVSFGTPPQHAATAQRRPSTYASVPGSFHVYDSCSGSIGVEIPCAVEDNSTGFEGEIHAIGSPSLASNSLFLAASRLPTGQWGIFLAGDGTDQIVPPFASGPMCVAGGTLRLFHAPQQADEIQGNGVGAFSSTIDTSWIQPGETWGFQAWFRDLDPGPTSNFTAARQILFVP